MDDVFPTPDEVAAWLRSLDGSEANGPAPEAGALPKRIGLGIRHDNMSIAECDATFRLIAHAFKMILGIVAEEIAPSGLTLEGYDISADVYISKEQQP